MGRRIGDTLSGFILRRSRLLFGLAIVATLVSAVASVRLYSHLKLGLTELLPSSARSVRDLAKVKSLLPATDALTLVVFSKQPEQSRRFVDALAAELDKYPAQVARVEYRIDSVIDFFKRREALYFSVANLQKLRQGVQARIDYERELYNPLNIFSGIEIPEPKLELGSLYRNIDPTLSAYMRFPGGYYTNADQTVRVLLVYPTGQAPSIDRCLELKHTVEATIQRVNPARYDPALSIRFTGDVENLIEEQESILGDLKLSSSIVIVLVIAVILLYYRSWRATLALILSVLMSTLWTMALANLIFGNLNANSAFLASIIVGNGINFGIIVTARYMEERRRGTESRFALPISMRKSARATLTAALAAGVSYASLMATSFRGFSQFGVIGLIGMLLCWAAALSILPVLLKFLLGNRAVAPLPPGQSVRKAFALMGEGLTRLPAAAVIACGFVAIGAIFEVSHLSTQDLETDLSALRSRRSQASGSAHYADVVDQIFGRYLSPVVILPRTSAHAQEIAARLKALQSRLGVAATQIASVQTLQDFIPRDQAQKIAILRQIRASLPRLARFSHNPLAPLFTPEAFRPFGVRNLPAVVLDHFREADGTLGRMVLVTPPTTATIHERATLARFIRTLRQTADSVEPGAPVTGTLPITSDMFEALVKDGPKVTGLALACVSILVVALLGWRSCVLILFALYTGVLWLGALIMDFGLKINFLNFIALPITFGIGVDYAVNIVSRYRQDGPGQIPKMLEQTGAAVALCSLTTIIGYSSLLIADNRAFSSFGLLAVLGEITCLSAAIVTVPAILALLEARRKRPMHGEEAPPLGKTG